MLLTVLFIASCVLTILFYIKKRNLETQGRDKEFAYYFSSNSLDFFAPFTLVLLLYVGLFAYISFSSETVSLQSLVRMEERLSSIQAFFSKYVRLSPERVFVLVILLYFLSILRIPFQKTYGALRKPRRITKMAYIFVTLICSFTLFGAQPGTPTEQLQFHIKTIRDGYADVLQQTKEAISEEAASELHSKVQSSFSPEYQKAIASVGEIGKQVSPIQQLYKSAQAEHGIKLPRVESTLGVLIFRGNQAAKLKTELQIAETSPSKSPGFKQPTTGATEGKGSRNAPASENFISQYSHRQVSDAKKAIEGYRQSLQAKLIPFLTTEEGKVLSLRVQKVLTGELSKAVFSSWVETYPILRPITDQFVVATLNNDLQSRREQITDRAAEAIMKNPGNVQEAVKGESSKLIEQTEVKISPEIKANADQIARKALSDIKSVEGFKAEIDAEVKRAESNEIKKLIGQLRSPTESVRESAARSLAAKGDRVSQAHVNELINIMRRGNQTFSKFLYRESHCRWFEYTSVKYYAADVLAKINSPHVGGNIASEAERSKGNSKTQRRVMDPGWI